MPAEQHGSTYQTKSAGWAIRWRDETGARKRKSGFKTEKQARTWYFDVERKRMRGETIAVTPPTLRELVDEYLGQHVAEANTTKVLAARLKLAVDGIPVKRYAREREHGLGEIRIDRLDVRTVGAWRRKLPGAQGYDAHKGLRQVLGYALRAKLVSENVATLVPNAAPKRKEVAVFGSWDEVKRLAEEMPPERRALPIVAVGCGLRPEEWLALERRDLDLTNGVLHVRRVYVEGQVKAYGKTAGSVRRIPLRRRVLDALKAHPFRLDTPLVFPAADGGHLDLHRWRRGEWATALDCAGLPTLAPYSMRHTFASFAIAGGVSLFYVSRLMGTSVKQIDATYGHLLPDSEEFLRGLLDAYDRGATQARELR
jgi:integrase